MDENEHAGAFKVENPEHLKMFVGIFGEGKILEEDVAEPGKPLKGALFLEDLKKSSRIEDKSIIHRKIDAIRNALGPRTRFMFLDWLIGEKFRCVLWGQNLVILCDDDFVIRHPRRDIKLLAAKGNR